MMTSQASGKKQSRNSTIELMRFIFTVGVCLHHFYSTFVDSGPYPFYNGYFAVEFFFVIGGYFLASSIDKISNDKPLWQNSLLVIKSRFFKLLIPFYVGHSITFILRNLFIQTPSLTQWFINYISDFSLLTFVRQAGFDYFYGYGHTWYISSMFLSFLIIVPLLIHYRKNFIF